MGIADQLVLNRQRHLKWRALDKLELALMIACGLTLFGFSLSVSLDIFTRTIGHPWLWLQEVTSTLFIYGIFAGTAVATRRNDHLYLTAFAEAMLVPMYAAFTEKIGGSILDAGIAFAVFSMATGGAVALHAKRGYRVKIVCLSFGERGESQFAWREAGATLASVKAGRKDEAARAAELLGAEIEFFDCGDYPLKLNDQHFDRMVDIYRETNPSFVLTHALEDPYNFDHPDAAHFAQQTRVVAQAMGHKPDAKYQYSAPPVFLFEPHQPEMCNFKPQVILNIDEVWETKRRSFEILAAQKHLWAYYERVALQRGMQGGRNSGKAMTYGEAYQRLFPMALEELV